MNERKKKCVEDEKLNIAHKQLRKKSYEIVKSEEKNTSLHFTITKIPKNN